MITRRARFRVAAIGLGLLMVIAVEGVCRWIVHRTPGDASDGMVEYLGQRPLFVQNASTEQYEIADNRRAFFAEDAFPIKKSANTKRIFVLGGSTVQGRPYSLATSFPTCMEVGLQIATPKLNWEVVNCGGVSYASYRLIPILEEVLDYEPDAIIICTGHNEFLEFVTYQDAVSVVDRFGETAAGVSNFASVQLLRRLLVSPSEEQATSDTGASLSEEVDAVLDQPGGWSRYHRSTLQRERVVRQFERNLNNMVKLCADHSVPLLMVSPPVNLSGCPPFKSEFSEYISEARQHDFETRLNAATKLAQQDADAAISALQKLTDDEPEFALTWYQLGRVLADAKRLEEALTALQRACDEDVCPLRMTSSLAAAMNRVTESSGVDIVDLQAVLTRQSRNGIVGNQFLVDHVHPSFAANRQIGMLLAGRVLSLLGITWEIKSWKSVTLQQLKADFQKLDSMYFLRGQRALDNLNGWARGRSHGVPLESP